MAVCASLAGKNWRRWSVRGSGRLRAGHRPICRTRPPQQRDSAGLADRGRMRPTPIIGTVARRLATGGCAVGLSPLRRRGGFSYGELRPGVGSLPAVAPHGVVVEHVRSRRVGPVSVERGYARDRLPPVRRAAVGTVEAARQGLIFRQSARWCRSVVPVTEESGPGPIFVATGLRMTRRRKPGLRFIATPLSERRLSHGLSRLLTQRCSRLRRPWIVRVHPFPTRTGRSIR